MSTTSAYDPGQTVIPAQRSASVDDDLRSASGRDDWPVPPGAIKLGLPWEWPAARSPDDGLVWPRPDITNERAALEVDMKAIEGGSFVYYFVLARCPEPGRSYTGTQLVKIGFTTNLQRRFNDVARTWGPIDAAASAWEGGGRAMEELRHWQFADSRVPCMPLPGGSEIFEFSPLLRSFTEWRNALQDWKLARRSSFPPRPSLPGFNPYRVKARA